MMLSLSELNALKAEADVADRRAASSAALQERLRQIRIGDAPLMVAYKNLGHWENDMRHPKTRLTATHPAPVERVALTDKLIDAATIRHWGRRSAPALADHRAYARAVIAEYERANGISKGEQA